ncbi:BACON domain-containing carbohydrate-binding protein [uncultured Prevotella sp.]|uniref:BACON domain-containing protein n=1 Tax=uncultured Prevotella sp. TaxID=159272 RepID=UPI002665BFBC|nr:BACON domain-containing carbohydrate-binding protein [uncultured Prevotella sp.]
MYIKKLTIWLFMLLAMVSTACSDIRDIVGGGTQDLPSDGVVLTLKLPNFTKNTVATRANEQQQINKLCVLCYDAEDKYLGRSNITSSNITPINNGKYQVKVKAVPGTATLHIVANTDITENDAINLYKAVRSTDIDLNAPVCWGSITVENLLSPSPKVWLFRQFAKASVTKDPSLTNFEITGFKIVNTALSGTIATQFFDKVALPSVECSKEIGNHDVSSSGELSFYETPADKAYMIIRAKYDGGANTYYKVAFQSKNSDGITFTPMALLRNHHYQVKVTAVSHEGYSTVDEAEVNQPENTISTEVVDDNPPIVDMIACRDYELGVCGEQVVNGNVLKATVTFVTTELKSGKYNDFSVVSNNKDWITVPDKYKSDATRIDLPSSAADGSRSSKGRQYTVQLSLTENFDSKPHTGSVTITSGDLSRVVRITQLGYDFRHDPSRIVRMRDLENKNPDLNQDNYFEWMENSLKGIRPEQNQGRVRNDGLHFFVGKNQVYYLIPYIDGDKMTCNDSRVEVKHDSGNKFWEVRLTESDNYEKWISREAITIITITNARTKITVTYPVYHVGLFAQLTGDAAGIYQLGNSKASGWRYYEMVNVKAGDKTYHMLDRNLGATNNGYYSPATTALEGNVGAKGGYFIISKAQSSDEAKKTKNDVVDALAIGNFKVCDNTCLQNLIDNKVLKIEEKTTDYGEGYNCICIKTADSEIPEIYIPMSGYYEGKLDEVPVYKDSNHANLWTCSRLSDYQGFSSTSPEYGFWYLYLDAFGKSLNLSNYRFVSGSSGMNKGRYRAMPVRLVAE